MANSNKYLDLEGVRTLWEAITTADGKVLESVQAVEAKLGAKIDYDSETNELYLSTADGKKIEGSAFKASVFLKDSFLQDVSIVSAAENEIWYGEDYAPAGTKFIKFTWNVDTDLDPKKEGKQQVDYLRVDEVGKTYQGDNSTIEISTDNKISVKEVTGDKVAINSIPVGGTPLADILTSKGINTIEAGNIQAVLQALFSKEDWPTLITRITPTSVSVTQAQPTISFSKTLAAVGETITVSASVAAASGSATVSYKGFTYGYSSANDNTRDSETVLNPPSVNKNRVWTSGNYNLTADITKGFTDQSISTDNITTSTSGASLSSTSLVVDKGENTVKVTSETPKFSITITASDMPAYYACSTLKNTSTEHMIAAASENIVFDKLTASNSKSSTVIGVYPILCNATIIKGPETSNCGDGESNATAAYTKSGTTNATTFTPKLSAITNGSAAFYLFVGFSAGGFTIKLPKGWKITTAQTKSDTVSGKFDGGISLDADCEISQVNTAVAGEVTFDYNIYKFNIAAANVVRLKVEAGNPTINE